MCASVYDATSHLGSMCASVCDATSHLGSMRASVCDATSQLGPMRASVRDATSHLGSMRAPLQELGACDEGNHLVPQLGGLDRLDAVEQRREASRELATAAIRDGAL